MLIDRYGRTATDLRVSLTDRCNLRCQYCMPAEGLDWLPKPDVLTAGEIIRLVRIAVERLGVRDVRFTGGEPLIRPELVEIVAACARLRPRPKLSLTTNGIGLARVVAVTTPDNEPSIRLLAKLGFEQAGVVQAPDAQEALRLFSTAPDWPTKRSESVSYQ